MSAGIDHASINESERLEELGLVADHSYGILDVAEVRDRKGNQVRLIKLRNLWGNFEWTGDWSDHSDCWTLQLKQ